ncbi:unnamed protein product [Arctia plantaginis]|uniref:Uncharacterized protein n=1 Tax=Arctia plantaginis TaxID=874455 RepID=A0A8S0Z868_ARCPL|nr:unnamed protein product [Arctia plantaginis]CAB3256771.1 unnamed protein product [Arctia plantaginis]
MCLKIIFFIAIFCAVNGLVVTIKAYVDDMASLTNSVDNVSVHSCNNKACDQSCSRFQLTGGVCVNGRCKCDNFQDWKEFLSLKRCYAQECDKSCYARHFAGGFCIDGRCHCYSYPNLEVKGFSAEDTLNNDDENDDLTLNRIAEDTVMDSKVSGYYSANSLNQH